MPCTWHLDEGVVHGVPAGIHYTQHMRMLCAFTNTLMVSVRYSFKKQSASPITCYGHSVTTEGGVLCFSFFMSLTLAPDMGKVAFV